VICCRSVGGDRPTAAQFARKIAHDFARFLRQHPRPCQAAVSHRCPLDARGEVAKDQIITLQLLPVFDIGRKTTQVKAEWAACCCWEGHSEAQAAAASALPLILAVEFLPVDSCV